MEENEDNQEQHGPDELVTWANGLMKEAKEASAKWRENAREDYGFFSGDQWDDGDIKILEEQNRPACTFNRIARTINAVSGTEIQNRQEVTYLPRELGDSGVNDVLTQASKWVRDLCDAEDEESESFKDLLICGIGATIHRLDYEVEQDGQIVIERADPLEVFWDASAKKRNLIDSRWRAIVRKVSRDEYFENWPGQEIDSKGEDWLSEEDTPHDSSPPYYDGDKGSHKPKDIEVVEFQYYKAEKYARCQWMDGAIRELDWEVYEKIKPRLDALGLRSVPQKRRKYYKMFINGERLLEHMPLESQEDFTIQIMTGMRDRNKNSWFGLVRLMIDPQRLANKFFSQMIHIINTSAKSGVYLETGAVDNVTKFEDDFAKAGSVSWLNPGSLSKGMLQEKQSANFPAAMDRLLQYSVDAINDIPGVNAELMGIADYSGQSGVLEHARKQAGVSLLSVFFDSLRRYRKETGRLLAGLIRDYIPEGTLIRVVDKRGQQYIPLAKDKLSMKFDVVVDDSPSSPNMKEKTFGILSSILPSILQAGLPIPPEIIEYAPLPQSLIDDWKKMLQPNPEQQQKEQKKEAIMDAAMIAEMKKDETQAEFNKARAIKTAAEVGGAIADTRQTIANTNIINTENKIKQTFPLQ